MVPTTDIVPSRKAASLIEEPVLPKATRDIILDEAKRAEEGGSSSKIDLLLSTLIEHTLHFYTTTGQPLSSYEDHIQNAWYACIQGAKHVPSSSHQQSSIIFCILAAKAAGPLEYKGSTVESGGDERARQDPPTFSDGRAFFPDLPLFAASLLGEFTGDFYQSSMIQQINLATFIGRLLAVGVYDGTALCALSLFREVLEKPRPLMPAASDTAGEEVLSMDDLIPVLYELIESSGVSLAVLASRNLQAAHTSDSFADFPHLSSPGELTMKSGSTAPFPPGYSPERWGFWAQRLRELEKCGVESIEQLADGCMSVMWRAESNTNLLGQLADRKPVPLE